MATTVAILEAKLLADTRDFDRGMDQSDGKMKSLAKTMGKAGLLGAVGALGAGIKIGVGEFMEAQKVTAQTNAVLKSTAGVANVSAEQVGKLSESLMKKSGVDDEVIASGQNMLLTFTKIRNETGKGNDVFNQATKATLDLSVAMGKDMQSSAILVGKALNDPIKGATALSRAGVQLDEDQKKLIKTMVASGNTMGAQKIILKELETQFGGSAEAAGKTFAGQISIARERLNNFAGEMVARSIPVLQSLVRMVNEDVLPALRRMSGWVQEHIVPTLQRMWEVAREVWQGIARVLRENEPQLQKAGSLVRDIGRAMLWLVNSVVLPVLQPLLTKGLPAALNLTIDSFATLARVIDRIIDGIKWLIENVKKIPRLPFSGGKSSDDLFGDGPGNVNLMGASPVMAPFAAAASGFGLTVTSGLRPGAVTRNGTPSDHAIGKALDVAGPASAMAAFFRSLVGNRLVKQAFYDPLGSIFGGAWSSYREGGHSDHVHVATYDKGGVLKPGLTLAYNGTGRNEYVTKGEPILLQLNLDGREFARAIFDPLKTENTRQGRLGRGL